MRKTLIAILISLSVFYIIKSVGLSLKNKRAEVKEGITYKRSRQPIAYWTVIFAQTAIAIALVFLLTFAWLR